MVGGDGNDSIQGGPGRNLIIAGSVLLDRTTHLFNYTNPRFQDLSGTLQYNVTPSNTSAFGQSQNDGTPQCDPTGHAWWSDFLSNGGNAGTFSTPSCTAGTGPIGITLSAPLNTPNWPQFLQDSADKGADYIAGGSGSSYIFGESNNNIIQAHGSIDIAYPTTATNPVSTANQAASNSETSGDPYAGASSCMFAGFTLGDRVGACRTMPGDPLPVDPTLPLQLTPSLDNYGPNYSASGTFAFTATTITRTDSLAWADFGFALGQTLDIGGVEVGVITGITFSPDAERLAPSFVGCTTACSKAATLVITDGESYVEGGRGNNVIFANQGQNDIVERQLRPLQPQGADRELVPDRTARERVQHHLQRLRRERRLRRLHQHDVRFPELEQRVRHAAGRACA